MIAVTRELPAKAAEILARVPAFPSVALKLSSLLSDENSSFSAVAACIASDPVLSGQLLRRANAADQANYCEARSVFQAVSALGVDRTRELTLTIAAAGYAPTGKSALLTRCWNHSLACAMIASDLARLCGLRSTEAFTAALLHDIGRFGLLNSCTAQDEEILGAADLSPDELSAAERRIFGADHVEAGQWLARQWNLPESIQEVIRRQHHAPEGALDQVAIVQMACSLAGLLGFPVNPSTRMPVLEEVAAALPQWLLPQLTAHMPTLQAAIVKEIGLFGDSGAPRAGRAESAGPSPSSPVSEASPAVAASRKSRVWILAGLAAVALAIGAILLYLR